MWMHEGGGVKSSGGSLPKTRLATCLHMISHMFVSKINEKAALAGFKLHLYENKLFPGYQSAYREDFSTEVALTKVHNDLLLAMDNKKYHFL